MAPCSKHRSTASRPRHLRRWRPPWPGRQQPQARPPTAWAREERRPGAAARAPVGWKPSWGATWIRAGVACQQARTTPCEPHPSALRAPWPHPSRCTGSTDQLTSPRGALSARSGRRTRRVIGVVEGRRVLGARPCRSVGPIASWTCSRASCRSCSPRTSRASPAWEASLRRTHGTPADLSLGRSTCVGPCCRCRRRRSAGST